MNFKNTLNAIRLFLSIVWREYHNELVSINAAWATAKGVWL